MGLSSQVVRRFLRATSKSYHEWLEEKGYKLTPEQFAGHRNFLELVSPALKSLEHVLDKYDYTGSWEGGAKFSREELQTLVEAKRILKGAEFPIAGLTIEEKKPKIIRPF